MSRLQANNDDNNKNNYLPAVEWGWGSPSSSNSTIIGDDLNLKMYNLCVKLIVSKLDIYHPNIYSVPVNVQIDLYQEMFMNEYWIDLNGYLKNLPNFIYLLTYNKGQRQKLHMWVQRLMDEGLNLTSELRELVLKEVNLLVEKGKNAIPEKTEDNRKIRMRLMQQTYALAGFFIEAGWYIDAEKILSACLKLYLNEIDGDQIIVESWIFRIKTRLLAALVGYSRFKEASQLYVELVPLICERNYADSPEHFDLAQVYNEFASLFAAQSVFKEAYKWSCQAIIHLTNRTPKIASIDILLTTSRSCIFKRDFEMADYLLRQALIACKDLYQLTENCDFSDITRFHPIVGDLLITLGHYYHNIDDNELSVKFHGKSVDFRKQYFGLHTLKEQCINLPLALARQELAFEYYIQEYATGHFEMSLHHIELAIKSLETLLPKDHHLLSNALRVKALIIEEQAIDNGDVVVKTEMLMEANQLHRAALKISREILGEENLQTAKHYSNLGRLYQSMHRFEDSEMLQLRAIEIKEKCLGKDEHEVAQSYGFLASLYSYDMEMYDQAEKCYLKAIDIETKIFGGAYIGLEFDYQGIIRVYLSRGDTEKADEYLKLLRAWRTSRLTMSTRRKNLFTRSQDESLAPFKLTEIKRHFLRNRLHQI